MKSVCQHVEVFHVLYLELKAITDTKAFKKKLKWYRKLQTNFIPILNLLIMEL